MCVYLVRENREITRNRLSAGLCPDPLGELTAHPRSLAGLSGLLLKGQDGRGREERDAGKEDEGKGREWKSYPPRMKILDTALTRITTQMRESCNLM